jgi:hypothetical protein
MMTRWGELKASKWLSQGSHHGMVRSVVEGDQIDLRIPGMEMEEESTIERRMSNDWLTNLTRNGLIKWEQTGTNFYDHDPRRASQPSWCQGQKLDSHRRKMGLEAQNRSTSAPQPTANTDMGWTMGYASTWTIIDLTAEHAPADSYFFQQQAGLEDEMKAWRAMGKEE